MALTRFDDFFTPVRDKLDIETIRQEWQTLGPAYNINQWLLPLPLWCQRPFEHSGELAWDIVCHDLQHSTTDRPFCIYLHVPFCSSKCGFCDSYSFKLGAHIDARMDGYVERLCDELQLWSERGTLSQRRVSTVHLGGGTPTFLTPVALTKLVNCCQSQFMITPDTEWALESTVSELTPCMIETMHELGFRRLHIGVQSMDDLVRQAIGRRSPTTDVLDVIQSTRALGWIVSVDLICGLPYQTLASFIAGIESLIDAGVNGFSLYELLIYPQNQRWAKQHDLINRDHLPNYFMFLSGAHFLETKGFHKNLFNHWADAHDKNVYFTFPTRGEDLLAAGAIADGVIGDYHYRHPPYLPYVKTAYSNQPGFEGGLRRTRFESQLYPFLTAIQSGTINSNQLKMLQNILHPNRINTLLQMWLDNALVYMDDGAVWLTNSGSWFAGNLIHDLTEQLQIRSDD
jgi:coproporphyrinogen III oxidase-like Fe-S oxidoreductase